MMMVIQDENGVSYWAGFEVKSTIRGLLAIILGLLCFAALEIWSNLIWFAALFIIGGFASCIGGYDGRKKYDYSRRNLPIEERYK
jgi:hypothetical protein